MTATISITNKGQMHVPVSFRKMLGLSVPGLVKIEIVGSKLMVVPVKSKIMEMAGKYSHKTSGKNINIEKIRDEIDYSKA